MSNNLLGDALKMMSAGYKVSDSRITHIHFALVKDNQYAIKDIVLDNGDDIRHRLTMSIRSLIDISDFDEHEYNIYVYATAKHDKITTQNSYKNYPYLSIYKVMLTDKMDDIVYLKTQGMTDCYDLYLVHTDMFKKSTILGHKTATEDDNIALCIDSILSNTNVKPGQFKSRDVRVYCAYNHSHIEANSIDVIERMPIIYMYDIIIPDNDVWQFEKVYDAFSNCEI